MKPSAELQWSTTLFATDVDKIRKLVAETGYFSAEETTLACEIAEEVLLKGAASGYHFIIAHAQQRLIGYCCYGEIPGTIGSFDVYWIAVEVTLHGQGIGRKILERTETAIRKKLGRKIFIDTSGRDQYLPTHAFYEKCGYALVARLKDFFSVGDDKYIFEKTLQY